MLKRYIFSGFESQGFQKKEKECKDNNFLTLWRKKKKKKN